MLSDSELIHAFVDSSLQRQEVLLANASLSAQSICNCNQLVSRSGGVLVRTKLVDGYPHFSVRAQSAHWQTINQALVAQRFLLMGEIDRWGFYQYERVKLPAGYQSNCTPASQLWRAWWKYQQRIARASIPMELLIRTRDTWYPVKKIECGNGLIYVRTLGNEIQLHAEDLVVWLNKIDQPSKPSPMQPNDRLSDPQSASLGASLGRVTRDSHSSRQ